jgi:hypothetical protein
MGETDGPTLRVGLVNITQPVTVQCRECGFRRKWRPGVAEEETDKGGDK